MNLSWTDVISFLVASYYLYHQNRFKQAFHS